MANWLRCTKLSPGTKKRYENPSPLARVFIGKNCLGRKFKNKFIKEKKLPAKKYFFTSESVTEGHPDKMCDQISDAVLDNLFMQDPFSRVACETFVTVGLVIVGGEITSTGFVDLPNLVRPLIKDIGYIDAKYGFSADACAILNAIGPQSSNIAQGVDIGGAGDQGLMIGYA